jgi:hypothetical protein
MVGAGQELATAGERLARAGASVTIGPVPTASLVSIRGRDRVTGAVTRYGRATQRHSVDLVVFSDRSPNLDLVMAAGAVLGRQGETLVPITDGSGRTSVASLFVAGSAAGRPLVGPTDADIAEAAGRAAADHAAGRLGSGPEPRADTGRAPGGSRSTQVAAVARGAMVCFCEDVRAWEVRAEQAAGYTDPELIKRRTGALTGPCQGKSCLQAFATLTGDPGEVAIPTARPPLRPVRLGDLVATDTDPAATDGDT